MIAIVDYGMGNLRSAQKGFERAGHDSEITDDPEIIAQADAVVLPGVGAFKDCYDGLCARGLVEPLRAAADSGRPFLGICVGLQLLFEASDEGEGSEGLGILPGRVVRFADARATGLKVPHMGWNRIRSAQEPSCALLAGASEEPYVYFVHSYYAQPTDDRVVLATAEYGVTFPAMVGRGNIYAVQFHPEKSQREGIRILEAFGNLARNGR
ncbi:MAG TPA: imidazole glycerol phosphate synthase subunit HisH [Candidatus Hydrogenedentes bacterium]|nr:imidazole glycerol phosphate synthase subunit HisH [Candidatus Hydrogenedentota bacterium]HPG66712.1 imidazole glycerol phosphate synthase subunit HisH [Candidatus Hydrogenedentota bacterium]